MEAALKSVRESNGVEFATRSIGRLFGRTGNDLASGVSGLFQDQSFLGGKIPGVAQTIAGQLGGADIGAMAEFFQAVAGNAKAGAGGKQEIERSLAATESRFLTRGRGQMSMGEQKNLEEQKKTNDILARMAKAFEALGGENLLFVEGIN